MFDSFRLFFYGGHDIVTEIEELPNEEIIDTYQTIYDLNGRIVRRSNDLKGLPKGIHIAAGRKIVVR